MLSGVKRIFSDDDWEMQHTMCIKLKLKRQFNTISLYSMIIVVGYPLGLPGCGCLALPTVSAMSAWGTVSPVRKWLIIHSYHCCIWEHGGHCNSQGLQLGKIIDYFSSLVALQLPSNTLKASQERWSFQVSTRLISLWLKYIMSSTTDSSH